MELDELAETGNCLGQSLAFEGREQFLGGLRCVAELLPLPFGGGAHDAGSQIKQANQEVIRVWAAISKRPRVSAGKSLRL
jgi:hypothetical protein